MNQIRDNIVKFSFTSISLSLLCFLMACEESEPTKNYNIIGVSQKGPYVINSEISIEELNSKLQTTGKVVKTETQNNSGHYLISNASLASNYILAKVDGLYFSETHGTFVLNKFKLEAMADLNEGAEVNINLLTHLILPRIEKLIQTEKKSFNEAKKQAEFELLSFFSLENSNVSNFSTLNLIENNEGGRLLLAVSSIFDFLMQDGDPNDYIAWLELISNFRSDLADNGIIDSERIQNKLLTTASLLSPTKIKEFLEIQYDATVADISEPINQFIENSTFVNYFEEMFPASSSGYTNLLSLQNGTTLDPEINYAIIVNPPQNNIQFYIDVVINKKTCDTNECFEAPSELWSSESDTKLNLILTSTNKPNVLIPISITGAGNIDLIINKTIDRIYPSSEPDKRIYW